MAATLNQTRPPVDRQARLNEALRLRQSNVSYPRIAEALGCSGSTAYEWVREGLEQLHRETIDEASRLQSLIAARLDDVSRRAYTILAQSANDPEMALRAMREIRQTEMERAEAVRRDRPAALRVGATQRGGDDRRGGTRGDRVSAGRPARPAARGVSGRDRCG